MSDIQQTKSFEQKMKERIKDSMGDLLSDEELSTLIKRSVEEVFFAPTKVSTGLYHEAKEGPSLLHKIIKEILEEQVKEQVGQWIKDHQEEVVQAVEKVTKEGAGVAIISALDLIFQSQFNTMNMNVQNMLRTGR